MERNREQQLVNTERRHGILHVVKVVINTRVVVPVMQVVPVRRVRANIQVVSVQRNIHGIIVAVNIVEIVINMRVQQAEI